MAIAGNLLYHLSQKAVPDRVNPLASVAIAYLVALCATFVALLAVPKAPTPSDIVRQLNWPSVGVGISIVAVELGFLGAYRGGWDVGYGSLITSVGVTLLLIPFGMLLYHEESSPGRLLGAALCVIGLILVNTR